MTSSDISNLMRPLQSAVFLQSWEDAEDIAKEISRMCRLKRLEELQKVQEALAFKKEARIAPGVSQVANTYSYTLTQEPAFRPEPEITLETRFDEFSHEEEWRNEVAIELNWILELAESRQRNPYAVKSIAARVAQFEEIKVKP